MKKRQFMLTVLAGFAGLTSPGMGLAGSATGSATEVTQVANNIELAMQYALQVEEFAVQVKQWQIDIQNMLKLSLPDLGPDVENLINSMGAVMSAGKAIGSNLAQINKTFSEKFKNSFAGDLASKFSSWHQVSIDTMEGALKTAGLHNELLTSDTAKIKAIYNTAKKSSGNLEALHSLASIRTFQMEQTQRLSNLIATQNLAATTFMAQQTSRKEEREKRVMSIMGDGKLVMPKDGKSVPGIN